MQEQAFIGCESRLEIVTYYLDDIGNNVTICSMRAHTQGAHTHNASISRTASTVTWVWLSPRPQKHRQVMGGSEQVGAGRIDGSGRVRAARGRSQAGHGRVAVAFN